MSYDWVEMAFDAPKASEPGWEVDQRLSTNDRNWFYFLERCACGALRYEGRGSWDCRNSRRGAEPDPAPVVEPLRRRWWQAWRRNDG